MGNFQNMQVHLWEMLQEMLRKILWEMAGGMMQFFHLTHG